MNFGHSSRCAAAAVVAGALTLTGCGAGSTTAGGSSAKDGTLNVVVAFYPYEYVAQQVGGEHVKITNLTAPGAEAHGLELTPKQIQAVSSADLVIYQKGFQAAVDDAVAQHTPKHVVDVSSVVEFKKADEEAEHDHDLEAEASASAEASHDHDHEASASASTEADHDHEGEDGHEGHDHGGIDPHVWLDVTKVSQVGDAVAKEMGAADQAHQADYTANAQKLGQSMTTLDGELNTGLKNCKIKTFIASHDSFSYFADRYGLEQVAIAGLSPEEEASPARIAEVQATAKDHGVTTIFYETTVSPKVSEAIAGDLKLTTDVLDPLESLSKDSRGSDYVEVMKSNLTALQKANQCS